MMFAAVVYDSFNIIVRVEVRPTLPRAVRVGEFFTKYHSGYWYKIVSDPESISLYQSLINC